MSHEPELGAPRSSRCRVLVVDDNDGVRFVMGQVLRRGGYDVTESRNAHEARQFARALRFELLLVDLNLPDADGEELATELCAGNATRRVLFVTGQASASRVVGAATVLGKPFTGPELLAAVRELAGPPLEPPPATPGAG